MLVSDKKERGRFLRFAVVGAIGAVVDFGVFNLLTQLTAIPAVTASVLSFIAAFLSNFTWNRFWTYPDSRSKRLSQQLGQFMVVSIIGLIIRTPLFAWMERILLGLFEPIVPQNFIVGPLFIAHNLALAVAILVVMVWNFFANRYWTYGDVDK